MKSRARAWHDAGSARIGTAVAIALAALATVGAPSRAAAQGAVVTEASDAEKGRAQELYKAGATSYEFRRWDDALRKFRDSYEVVRSPNTHLMIGRVLIELGQKVDAYNELVATEAEARAAGEKYAEAASKASELRATLARDVALIQVEVQTGGADPAGATVLVGGADHPRVAWGAPLARNAGEVEVIGRWHGAERTRQKVSLVTGSTVTVKLLVGPDAADPADAPPPPLAAPTAPPEDEADEGGSMVPLIAVSAAVGAGGFAVFTVFGLMNQSTFDGLEQRCSSGCSQAEIQDDVDEGKTQQTVANIGLIAGFVGVAAAATFLVIELTNDDGTATAGGTRVRVGPGGVSAAGSF
jgi:hypothetical protein